MHSPVHPSSPPREDRLSVYLYRIIAALCILIFFWTLPDARSETAAPSGTGPMKGPPGQHGRKALEPKTHHRMPRSRRSARCRAEVWPAR